MAVQVRRGRQRLTKGPDLSVAIEAAARLLTSLFPGTDMARTEEVGDGLILD
jgi:hypothetical protein